MEKEALLTIILQDIKELETLVNTFKGKKIIPEVFIQLSKSKTQGILDEIQLLASIKDIQETAVPPENSEKPVATPSPEPVANIEVVIEKPAATEPEKEVVEVEVVEKRQEKAVDKPKEPEQKKVGPPAITPPKNGNNTTVLGELLGKDKPSFNERLAAKQEPASKSQPPISDLRRAIGINDRFFFQRELFGGQADLFNQTIDQLNGLNSMDAALSFISTNFNWDPNNDAVTSFFALLRRRFIKQ